MKTIQARVTKNIKEDPSVEECNIWNIEATFLETLPEDAMRITTDPAEIGVNQLQEARATAPALPLRYEPSQNHACSLAR